MTLKVVAEAHEMTPWATRHAHAHAGSQTTESPYPSEVTGIAKARGTCALGGRM